MQKVDLHSHSDQSDGTLSPKELVLRAKDKGVTVLALTDHDTTSGIAQAKTQARASDIKLISGVEISTLWKKLTIHVVGLGVNPDNYELNSLLHNMQKARQIRAEKIALKLEKIGIKDCLNKAKKLSSDNLLTRSHYARLLVAEKITATIEQSFKKYLLKGRPGFVKGDWAELEAVISAIHRAGGLAVIAHPYQYKMTGSKLKSLLTDFKKLKGDGIEVINAANNPDVSKHLSRLCQEFNFYASTGSDFHSPGGYIELGKLPAMPKNLKPIWQQL